MKIKDFLQTYPYLKLEIQHLGICGGGYMVRVFNTTAGFGCPTYEHFYLDEEIENLNIDFDAAILIPIINQIKESTNKYKKWLEKNE